MRILFSSLAAHGHLYPLVPLARSLAEAGHEVLFATGAEFHPLLAGVGLIPLPAGIPLRQAFVSLGESMASAADADHGSREDSGPGPSAAPNAGPADLSPEQTMAMGRQVFGNVLPRAFVPDLLAIINDRQPDLVVAGLANQGALLAARARQIPVVSHGFGLVNVSFGGRGPDGSSLAADLGLDLPTDLPPAPIIDICPPSLRRADDIMEASPGPLIPLRPVALRPPGPGTDLSWRDRAVPLRPLVYLTLGTAFGSTGVLREAITGLGRLAIDVLVASGPTVDPAELTDLPRNVRVEQWVQQADVLAEASVVVHHGGSGTTLGATAAGAPQLFLPQGADQFHNAEAVVGAGAALQLRRQDLSPDSVVEAVGSLLTESGYRMAAERLAAEVAAMPSPDEVAALAPGLVAA